MVSTSPRVADSDTALRTSVVGSLPRPGWFKANAQHRAFRQAMNDSDYNEQYTDAVSSLIRDQERAGLDLVTDGDSRLDNGVGGSSWALYPAERLGGVAPALESRAGGNFAPSSIFRDVDDVGLAGVVVDEVSRGGLEYSPLFRASQRLTSRPVKFSTPSAEVIMHSLVNRYYKRSEDLVLAIADALNAELSDVAASGCTAVQIDAPWITRVIVRGGGRENWTPEFYSEVFRQTVRGLSAKTEVWAHLCWGNAMGQRRIAADASVSAALDMLNELPCDVLTFENADNNGIDLDEICKNIEGKTIAFGVLSHRNLQVETPEEVAAMLRRALQWLPPERLAATSDCGFGRDGMSRRIALHKMINMQLGVNLVRKELGLPERRILAADPALALV
jgi:5-methyltetrahydropteroyltriglutamate--homocysteine methyltransferase